MDVPRDAAGNVKLPISLGALVVHSLGTVVVDRIGYHSEKYERESEREREAYTFVTLTNILVTDTSGPLVSAARACTAGSLTAQR